MSKVIVAGGRDFTDESMLFSYMENFRLANNISEVVCGLARGADSLGKKWAEENDVQVAKFPANWDKFGKSAGYRRNAEMAEYADMLVLFWDGKSRGSKHMLDIMKSKDKPYIVLDYDGEVKDWRV